MLNGSEVTSDEREKAERHYLRHFLDQEDKTSRYLELEKKHGERMTVTLTAVIMTVML